MKIYQFKAEGLDTKQYPLCLENVSKDIRVDNIKKVGPKWHLYHFSIDYDTNDTSDNVDINIWRKNSIL